MFINKLYKRVLLEPRERKLNRDLASRWEEKLNSNPKNRETTQSKEAALKWLLMAKSNTTHLGNGFDRAYNLATQKWERPYPETTGYIISSLIDASDEFPHLKLSEHAAQAGKWLEKVQFESGAICSKQWFAGNDKPSIFNTGMVLHGFVSLHQGLQDPEIENAMHRAAKWLMANQEKDGAWIKHAYNNTAHTYYTMVAWALARYGKMVSSEDAMESCIRNLNWTLSLREENGWIDQMNFDSSRISTTHTIAYTAQGLAECGIILNESPYIEAAISLVDPLNTAFIQNQYLPGAFDSEWNPVPMRHKNCLNQLIETGPWECLTGTAQTSCTNWSLSMVQPELKGMGKKMNKHLRKRQINLPSNPAIDGALSGSWPLDGPYDTLCLPNHAAKFFIDALNLEDAKS